MIKKEDNSLPKAAVLMKVGYHANEGLAEIILRKQVEEDTCGVFYWGYGGTLCHPTKQVVPFAKDFFREDVTLWLLMSVTPSQFIASPTKATEFSLDGETWHSLPSSATVTGSRYALVCKGLEQTDFSIDLSQYSVAIGPNKDRPVSEYMRSRVDKACAFFQPSSKAPEKQFTISFRARLVPPFAILVR